MNHVAVIDIGSNSVRLVIYDGLNRSPFPIFNEKVLCGLALDLEQTRMLNPEGRKEAEQALDRFITLSKSLIKSNVFIFATSAVRDAKDGSEFMRHIQRKHLVSVDILSEEQEAAHAAHGIVASIQSPHGVVGDLGGGSLELTAIAHGTPQKGISLPIGPLRFPAKTSVSKYKETIEPYVAKFSAHDTSCYNHFYAIGGAFRALAKIHMERKSYPLKILHHYTIASRELLSTLHIIQRMSESALQKVSDMPKKRSLYLPHTAILLEHYIQRFNPSFVTFSTHGVREGLLYSKLPLAEQNLDPLLSGCKNFMGYYPDLIAYGEALIEWISSIVPALNLIPQRILHAACLLSEISFKENPSYRADLAYQRILDASFTGITHKERFILAKILFCRYAKTPNAEITGAMHSLLTKEEIRQSQIAGATLRVAKALSVSNVKLLQKTALHLNDSRLTLQLHKNKSMLYGEAVEKRLHHLGFLLECDSYEITTG